MFTKRQIWALLVPLMIEQVLTSFMGTADTMMVSHAGSAAISAVALVDSVNILVIYIFAAMATGGTILCSQYIGSGQQDKANHIGKQLAVTVAILASALMLLCVIFRSPLLRLIFGQVEADVMVNAEIYFLITAISYPFIALYNAGAALFRASGNSKLPMQVSTVSNILNIIGNAVMIFGFQKGVAGAAFATLLSRIFCAFVILYFLRKPNQVIVVRDYFHIRLDMDAVFRILKVGIPNGVENGMFQFGKVAIQSTVSTMGTVAIAAQAMAASLEALASNAAMGIGLGMMTIVGQCIGAGRKEEARRYIIQLTWYAEISLIICCALMACTVRLVTRLAGMEPAAADLTCELIYIISVVKAFIWVFSFIPAYGMRGAGDVRFSMILTMSTMWSCRVLIVVILARCFGFGPIAVWIGMFMDWGVRGALFTWRFFSGKWMEKRVSL
ncbi:MAG: MATE family efflux transporter [Lachnospiraceae bacterium]|nr:MATE family efflux transporter [Lachnospiraceae bacterium]